jgi:hypothetical protein
VQPGTNGSGTEMPAGQHEGEQTVPPELQKFHDLFAPLWHSSQGPERMNATCTAVAELQADADAVAKATPPATANADKWTEGTRALVAGVKGVADACAAKDMGKFETALVATHEALHSLMAQAGMGDHEMPDKMHHDAAMHH